MAATFKAYATPSVLVWARKTAGYDLNGVASRLKITSERIAAWEAGTERPSFAHLGKLATVSRRALSVFLLPEPPKDGQTIRDFRSAGPTGPETTPELLIALRDAHERRE